MQARSMKARQIWALRSQRATSRRKPPSQAKALYTAHLCR